MAKTLKNTTASKAKKNVGDIKVWGDGDMFLLLSKAFSINEKWMKSTKAMQITGAGCVVQVTTQQGDNVAEAVTFVPNVIIAELNGDNGEVVERMLIPADYPDDGGNPFFPKNEPEGEVEEVNFDEGSPEMTPPDDSKEE